MSLNFQSIKKELNQNGKAIVQLNNRKFLVKKSNNKYKIRPVFLWIIRLPLHIISLFIASFPIALIIVLFKEIVLRGQENQLGGLLFIINVIALLIIVKLMSVVYNSIGYLMMNTLFKNEKQEILSGLNHREKGMSVEEFSEIDKDLQEVAERDANAFDEFNAILDKAEKRINNIDNEK